MAIKGKSRKRTKTRAPAQAPRPTLTQRKTPLALRRDVKRAVVIGLALATLLGGLRLWQNISRSDALRAYDRTLQAAQSPLIAHLQPDSITNMQQLVQQFTQGQLDGTRFIEVAALWEKDFVAAKDAVAKLKAPNEVAVRAQGFLVQGLDAYVGLARLYNLAGQVAQLAAAEKDANQKKALQDKVQVVLTHAGEWLQRANGIYDDGNKELTDLKVRYGLEEPLPAQSG